MDHRWLDFKEACEQRWKQDGLADEPGWKEFSARLDKEFLRLVELLWSLYGTRPDFAFQIEALVASLFRAWQRRPARLKALDEAHVPESAWFLSQGMVGAIAYVDLFAGSFRKLEDRIPYLRDLGIDYLHLMPFYRGPEKENDGGYAVSSYHETMPGLGSMEDFEHLAERLADAGISVVADFIFNHSSDEHEWALKAKTGDRKYQQYYWTFPDQADTTEYQASLREIFPETRRGNFTWNEEMGRWVWTTFHSYQWDLNYNNPEVFRDMALEMIGLANRGINILRLDAVAFIWKQKGTSCENLPQAHTIIRAFQAIARLACPSLLFKSEAIVHPDDIIKYVDLRECQLSYNPLLMAELWEAAATRETRLLAYSLEHRHQLPAGCAWVNYIRCHDDIGWTFADEDAHALGINGNDHRRFLNAFYSGSFPGSFSRGTGFQFNPHTGDMRICGTAASLAGIEKARLEGSGEELEQAMRRLTLLHGIIMTTGGIPLIYLGDEQAVENDYGYLEDPAKSRDSRWIHRTRWPGEAAGTAGARVHAALSRMIHARKAEPCFGTSELAIIGNLPSSILAYRKRKGLREVVVLANFGDWPVHLEGDITRRILDGRGGTCLLSGERSLPGEGLTIEGCGLRWLLLDQ